MGKIPTGTPNVFHHFVPQCYLRNFSTGPSKKVVMARLKGRTEFYPKKINEICGEDYLYRIPNLLKGYSDEQRLVIEKRIYANNIERYYPDTYNLLVKY